MNVVYTVWFKRDRTSGWLALVSAVALRVYKKLETARERAREKSREYGVSPVIVLRGRRLEDVEDKALIVATYIKGEEVTDEV